MTSELIFVAVWSRGHRMHRGCIEFARQKQNAGKLQSGQADIDLSSCLASQSHCAHWLVTSGLLAMPEQTGFCGSQKAV